MDHRSHANLARLLMPNAKVKDIEKVNSVIDNPGRNAQIFGEFVNSLVTPGKKGGMKQFNPLDYFGLEETAHHRKVGHDAFSSTMLAFNEVGDVGIPLANIHTMWDAVGEEIRKTVGSAGRNLWEAQFNYAIEPMVKKRRGPYRSW